MTASKKSNGVKTHELPASHCSSHPQAKGVGVIYMDLGGGDSPIPTGVLDHNVVVFVDPTDGAGGGERLKHAVGPASVPVLQGLHDLQVKVDVDQVSDLQTPRIPTAILLTY